MIKGFIKPVLLSLSILLEGYNPCFANQNPSDVVTSFHQGLTTAMKVDDYAKRLLVIEPVIVKHFQIHTIARISLGRYWRSLSAIEQTKLKSLLKDLVISTYTFRFKNHDGQVFSIIGTEPITTDRSRVKSLLKTRTETVSLNYQLQLENGSWKIYDIVANGVSDLSLKRSNYSAIFKKGGISSVQEEILSNISRNAVQKND